MRAHGLPPVRHGFIQPCRTTRATQHPLWKRADWIVRGEALIHGFFSALWSRVLPEMWVSESGRPMPILEAEKAVV